MFYSKEAEICDLLWKLQSCFIAYYCLSFLSTLQNMAAVKEWVFNAISQRIGSLYWVATIKKPCGKKQFVCCFHISQSLEKYDIFWFLNPQVYLFLFTVSLDIEKKNWACFIKKYLEISRINYVLSPRKTLQIATA